MTTYNYLLLPTSTEVDYQYDVTLLDTDYTFKFKFLTRDPRSWYLSILNPLGEILLSNLRLTPHVDLLSQYVSDVLPNGVLVLFSKSEEFETPEEVTLDNLFTNFDLLFITE